MKLQILQIKIYILLCIAAVVIVSCKKNTLAPALSSNNVSIKEALSTDTLSASVNKISNTKDSLVTVKLEAALKTIMGSGAHTVTLGVDTSKMAAYRAKYGNMPVLPTTSYFIPFADCNISAGTTTSSSAEINITSESSLLPFTTYVLPVVIKNVDGQPAGPIGQGQVIYLLIKTSGIDYGTPISKTSWSIVSYSSSYSLAVYPPADAIDNKPGTEWVTNLTGSYPQYITIDMAQSYNLKTVTYQDWASYSTGANPTQIMIELSTNGTTWTNMGTFTDVTPNATVKNLTMNPVTPARYIRFTVLQASVYASLYTPVAIAEIGANN